MRSRPLAATVLLLSLVALAPGQAQNVVNYDIVYVRAPRYGDTTPTTWPEVFDPISMEPGADLMLLHPDGREELLFAGGNGAVVDPAVSFDGEWVFFSYFHDLRSQSLNTQRRDAPRAGADIYKIHVPTRQVVRLTQQIWTPPTGAANWSTNHLSASPPGTYYLGYGIFNLGPCPLPGGRVMFTSSRDGYLPNKGYSFPNLRLYVMDADGKNVEKVGHLNIGSALHPTVLMDGRVMFASYEAQGLRDQRIWGLWGIWPDGRKWEPLMSAFTDAAAMHFQAQLSDGRIAVVEYYNLNNNGFGTLLAFNSTKQAGVAPFGAPRASHSSNPAVRRGIWWFSPSHPSHMQPRYKQYPFSPPGLLALSGFTHGEDEASSRALDGSWAGKVTHPSGAPDNDVLVVWSPGPANDLDRPTTLPRVDGGLYLLRSGIALTDHRQLVLLKNNPLYNEMQPRALVPYSRIYGVTEPAAIPFLPNDGSESGALPPGTPFGLVGTSSFYKRNTTPGSGVSRFGGLDPFNTSENGASTNWGTQGADAGKYSNADIHAVRVVALEGVAHRSYGPVSNVVGFNNHADTERLRILGEIPLRKSDTQGGAVLDGDGNPDTSFLARIPADTPFTFQTLDKDGLVLNMAQTWHQLRPGEVRTDCGGCHAHSQVGTDFSTTAASRGGYTIADLINKTPILSKDATGQTIVRDLSQRMLDVEYYRDIKPILQRSCVSCHTKNGAPPAGLALDDTAVVSGYENTYRRLANDEGAQYGIPPVISNRTWRESNASRYIRKFQSRRSLLMWKILGRRLDGWTNADHPTESVPGNAATLPSGANANDADIDFTGTIMPPPNSGSPALSEDEKMMIARWIDLGCPISSPDPALEPAGWFADELKPTLTVSLPRSGTNSQPLQMLRIGMYDSYSGIDRSSLSVVANFAVNGQAPGAELGASFTESGDHIWSLMLGTPVTSLAAGQLTVRVKDLRGNWSVVDRTFSVDGVAGPTTPVTVTSNPVGLSIVIDGATLTTPQTFNWTPGSTHTLAASTTAGGGSTRYIFTGWSNGGSASQTITTPDAAVVHTASYRTQHLLTRLVSPAGTGTLTASPVSADGFYDLGSSVQLTAVRASGFRFTGFQGDLTGTTNPQALVMSGPRSVTADFLPSVDATRPTVSMTAPLAGTVSGTAITVSANASDNVAVVGVQFKLNGQNLGAEDTAAPYSMPWNTTTVLNGTHQLSAVARDAVGNTATSTVVSVTVNNAPLPAPVSGLVAAYSFDTVSNGIVADESGNGNTGTVSGATFQAEGRLCGALSFDGVNDRVNIADANSLDLTTGMTLAAWVRPSSLNGWTTVILKERPNGLAYALYASDDTGRPPAGYIHTGGQDQSVTRGVALRVNAWTHLAVTYDGQNLRLYVNGVLNRTRALNGSIVTSGSPLRIGGNAVWGEYFRGLIDEVRVYSRPLSASEVLADTTRPIRAACQAGVPALPQAVSVSESSAELR